MNLDRSGLRQIKPAGVFQRRLGGAICRGRVAPYLQISKANNARLAPRSRLAAP